MTVYRALAAAILLALAAITLWNARWYPPGMGYDAEQHIEYAELLVREGRIPGPEKRSEYYTPPLFYAVSGTATALGEELGLGEPHRVAQAVNALVALATALLVLALARLLWPERPVVQLGALAFFVALPVVAKSAAMFHPDTLGMFFAAAGLYLAARMIVRREFRVAEAAALGAVLGAGQLVRAFALWTFAVVLLTLGAVALVRYAPPRLVARAAAVAVAATAVVAGPWYVRQALLYTNPVFDQPPTVAKPLWERRPLEFYVDPGTPELFTRPWRPEMVNLAIGETYTEVWGDWYGVYEWDARDGEPSADEARQLRAQQVVGVVPTLLAFGGWVALLVLMLRRTSLLDRPDRLLVALLPLAGIAGYLYFTVSYPTPDGDVLKATYLLTTAPAWALCFGWALDRVATRVPRNKLLLGAAAVFAGAAALVDLRFLVHGSVLGGLL